MIFLTFCFTHIVHAVCSFWWRTSLRWLWWEDIMVCGFHSISTYWLSIIQDFPMSPACLVNLLGRCGLICVGRSRDEAEQLFERVKEGGVFNSVLTSKLERTGQCMCCWEMGKANHWNLPGHKAPLDIFIQGTAQSPWRRTRFIINFSHQNIEIHWAPSISTMAISFPSNTVCVRVMHFFTYIAMTIYILYKCDLQHVSSIFIGVVLSHSCSVGVWNTSWSGGLGHPSIQHCFGSGRFSWCFFLGDEAIKHSNYFRRTKYHTSTTNIWSNFLCDVFFHEDPLYSHILAVVFLRLDMFWPRMSWRKSWTLNVRPGVGWRWTTVSGCVWSQAAIKPSPQYRETG